MTKNKYYPTCVKCVAFYLIYREAYNKKVS